jgi:phosphohistidine phosphatase
MKQLLICRHAKSSWKDSALTDIKRPLNKRGKRDAPRMGARLARRGMVPDAILCSPAKRARKTAQRLCQGMKLCSDVIHIRQAIYDTDTRGLFKVISKADNCFLRLMLVGHNYELTELVNELAPLDIYNVPTCGIVGFQLDINRWQDIFTQTQQADFLFFDYPKKKAH